jgi:hypothetical protein
VSNTPRTDEQINGKPCTQFGILAGDSLRNASVPSEFARTLERELNAAQDRIKRLEEALDLVRPYCSFVHHSKKHQHAYNEPCPVVALIEKTKKAKP